MLLGPQIDSHNASHFPAMLRLFRWSKDTSCRPNCFQFFLRLVIEMNQFRLAFVLAFAFLFPPGALGICSYTWFSIVSPIHVSLTCQNPKPSIHPVSALDPLHPDIFTWVDGIKYSCTTTLTITRTATAYIGGSSFVADTITWTIDSVTGSTVEIVTYRFPAATVSSFLATQAIKLVSPTEMLMSVVFRYWTCRYCLPDTVVV
jgi:hypothetical protein